MKAAPFEYVRAASVSEACELLRQDGDDIKLIAGGQSLAPMMAMRVVSGMVMKGTAGKVACPPFYVCLSRYAA